MKNRPRDEQDHDALGTFFGAALKGLAAALIFAATLSFIFTAVALGMDDPMKPLGIFALGTLFIGAAVGGIVSGKLYENPAAGLFTGALYVLIVWLISLFFARDGKASPLLTALFYALCLFAAFLGSFLSGRSRGRRQVKNHSPAARRRKARSR